MRKLIEPSAEQHAEISRAQEQADTPRDLVQLRKGEPLQIVA